MAHTDKTRPAWVQQFDPDVPASIKHNHIYGECIEETLDYARWAQSRPNHRHAWRNCRKLEWVEDPCPHDPRKDSLIESPCHTIWKTYRAWLGLNETMGERFANPWRLPEHEHHKRVRHEEWPCTCDDWPLRPTCDYSFDTGYCTYAARYYGGGVPQWYVDHTWNNPERVRVRDDLRAMAKEWNANGDLEDGDFPNYQHRHRSS